jgi:hypothetical protein
LPTYAIDCPCGAQETFVRRMVGGPVPCNKCGAVCPKVPTVPNLRYSVFETPGPSGSGSYEHGQQEGVFPSRQAFDKHLEATGKRVVSKDSEEGRKLRDRFEANAARTAARFGYDDADEFRAKARTTEHMTKQVEPDIPRLLKNRTSA